MTPDIIEGVVLRAEISGNTYRVTDVDYEAGTFHTDGLASTFTLEEITEDIQRGKITIVR
jgi:hypothetical protein